MRLAASLRWATQADIQTLDPHAQNDLLTNSLSAHVHERLTAREFDVMLRIARGQAASRTLGNGGQASNALTIDEFLAMDDGEVAQRLNTDAKFKAQVDALFGRRS